MSSAEGVHLFIETGGTALGAFTVDMGCLATLGEIKKEAFGLWAEEFNCICLLRDGQVHKREQMNFICLLMGQILSAFPCAISMD